MLKLSIILPVYNVELYLNRCLKSILPLLKREVELIIVNDGSTDSSLSIIKDFIIKFEDKKDQIKLIDQINKGLSGARNSGLKIAKGEYVWFIDSDDYIDDKLIEELFSFVASENSDIILLGRKIELKNREEFFTPFIVEEPVSGIEYFNLAITNMRFRTNVWDKIYKTSFIKELKLEFVEGLNYEDMLFNLIAFSNAKKISVFNKNIYIYNCVNTESITSVIREKDLDVLKFAELADKYVNNNSKFKLFQTAYHIMMFSWISSCLINKYVPKYKNNVDKRKMLKKVTDDKIFRNSAEFCSKSKDKIPKRIRIFSKLLLINSGIYCRITAIAVSLRSFLARK